MKLCKTTEPHSRGTALPENERGERQQHEQCPGSTGRQLALSSLFSEGVLHAATYKCDSYSRKENGRPSLRARLSSSYDKPRRPEARPPTPLSPPPGAAVQCGAAPEAGSAPGAARSAQRPPRYRAALRHLTGAAACASTANGSAPGPSGGAQCRGLPRRAGRSRRTRFPSAQARGAAPRPVRPTPAPGRPRDLPRRRHMRGTG